MDLPKLLQNNWQLILFFAFCLIALIQIFYYLFFFIRLAFYRTPKKEVTQTHAVSVIVCARDEAKNITRNLPGILVQHYNSTHEVIVVNDNSYDESKYLLEELRKQFRQLNIIELTQEAKMIPGKKLSLSIGIKSAKYEIILLTDADCVPATEHWIKSMQDAYLPETEIVLGYGAYQKLPGILNKLIRWETFHTALQYMSYALAGTPYMGVGRNLSYKRSVFFRHKGFSAYNSIPGGDDDLFINKVATKKNTAIVIDHEAHTISKPKTTWKTWRAQKRRHFSTSKYYKPVHKFLLGAYSFSHFSFYFLAIAAAIMYNWEIVAGIFLVKSIVQQIIFSKVMKKLNEADLIKWLFFMDVWMVFYYIFYAPMLWKKAARTW